MDLAANNRQPLPFWIINAAAPQHRGFRNWFHRGKGTSAAGDIFEMTAVSHGSEHYGFVSAPVSLYDENFSVLDGVMASAAFFDSHQLRHNAPIQSALIGTALHLSTLDWGIDIPNYNVGDARRTVHRLLPFPLYWLDSAAASLFNPTPDRVRKRSVFIRLMDGGNVENLGVYSLLRRGTQTIIVSDGSTDSDGEFRDLCNLARRLEAETQGKVRHLRLPGLWGFAEHCLTLAEGGKSSYDLRHWTLEFPLLVGCIRHDNETPDVGCTRLGPNDVRLLIAKPAVRMDKNKDEAEILTDLIANCLMPGSEFEPSRPFRLNCDTALFMSRNHEFRASRSESSGCLMFPQHESYRMTANSSGSLFRAYRELGRQYVARAKHLLATLRVEPHKGAVKFELLANRQQAFAMRPGVARCVSQSALDNPSQHVSSFHRAGSTPEHEAG